MSEPERRETTRLPLTRPVKLRCSQAGHRYLTGSTLNISAGGALVQIGAEVALRPNQTIELLIARQAGQAMLRADDRVPARVVRCLRHGGQRYIALRFAAQLALPLAQAG